MMKTKSLLIVIICYAAPVFSQVNGLVAKYSFNNGNAKDEIGNNDGKVVGATLTSDRFGRPDHAYHFDGALGNYINLGTGAALKPTACSISLWCFVDTATTAGSGFYFNPIISTKLLPGHDFYESYGVYYRINSSDISVFNTDSGTTHQPQVNSLSPILFRQWKHIVFTFDDDSIKFYLNGALQGSIYKGFRTKYLNSDSVMVGYSPDTQNNRAFEGAIDDILIYNHVITAKEADSLYRDSPTSGIKNTLLNGTSGVSLSPNPFTENISFNATQNINTIEILNLQGEVIGREVINANTATINTAKLPMGIYFIKTTLNKGLVSISKVVKGNE